MILLFPYAKKLNNDRENPKNYPYWSELVSLLKKDYGDIVQIGLSGEIKIHGVSDFKVDLKMKEIEHLIKESSGWISIDSFIQHLVNNMDPVKPGVVLWSQSNPNLFGYSYNLNILKDEKFLRQDQYNIWEQAIYDPRVYLDGKTVYDIIKKSNKI